MLRCSANACDAALTERRLRAHPLFQCILEVFGTFLQLLLESVDLLRQFDKLEFRYVCRFGSFISCFVSRAIDPAGCRANLHGSIFIDLCINNAMRV